MCPRPRHDPSIQYIVDIQSMDNGFVVNGNFPKITADSVVIATGGLSIQKKVRQALGIKLRKNLD
tara:strand:- start:307 stop:501 length:195 start_codon:yes stop_codon:yes gene_type:complete